MMKTFRSNWQATLLLLLLGLLNVLSGAFQLGTIQQGPPADVTDPDSIVYFFRPIPIVTHIIVGIIFNLMAPLQFAPVILNRWPAWHRWSGRLLVVAALLVGLTGQWMNHFFPQYGGFSKYPGILVNSVGIIVAIIIALWAVRRRDFAQHKVWMMRAVAFGLGPATQRLFLLPLFLILGDINPASPMIGLVIWFGFLLNLLVVELILRRDRRRDVAETFAFGELS